MKTLIVVSHPHIDCSNTQQFLHESIRHLPDVTWHHLDGMGEFDLPAEQRLVRDAERIVFQFPLYWYAAPASLKRWLDEVWVKQAVYDENGGLLNGKTLGFVISFSHPKQAYQLGGAEGVTLSALLAPYAALARKTGLRLLRALQIPQFAYQSDKAHQHLLVEYQQYLTMADPFGFDAQAEWWFERLAAKGKHDKRIQLVADTLQTQQEELERLQQTLHDLKQGESE